jgi:hypothetical protein
VQLERPGIVGNDRRDQWTLERSGRRDDITGIDRTVRRLHAEAGAGHVAPHGPHLDSAPDRGSDLFGVGDEVVRDLLLGREFVRCDVGEFHGGKPVMPGGSVRNQGIPASGTPALSDAVSLEDEMLYAADAQMLAHRQTGLPSADDQHLNRLIGPGHSSPGTPNVGASEGFSARVT